MARTDSLDITYQTLCSELVQRSLDESSTSEFSSEGRFVVVEVKEKKYWYFDTPRLDSGGQDRRYVADIKGRRLVSALTREAYLPQPPLKTGLQARSIFEAMIKNHQHAHEAHVSASRGPRP